MTREGESSRELGAVVEWLGGFFSEQSLETVLGDAARRLAELSGARAGAIYLIERGSVSSQYWSCSDETLREALAKKFSRLALEVHSTDEPLVTVFAGQEPLLLRTSAFGIEGGSLGAICLAFAQHKAEAFDEKLVEGLTRILATRVTTTRQITEFNSERARYERWFRTLDEQLRLLDRERQKFVAVANQSDRYALVIDPTYKVKWANSVMGSKAEELGEPSWVGRPLAEVWRTLSIRGPKPGSARCPIARVLSDGQVVQEEFRQSLGGVPRDLYLTALPINGADGKPDEVLVIAQDVSDLKVLRRSEERYRSLFERSPDAMFMVEPESRRIVLANPVAARLAECGTDDLLGRSIETIHDPDDWDRVLGLYEEVFAKEEAVVTEATLRTRTGRRVVANMSAIRFDLDEKPVILVELQDITERKRLQDELRHSQKMEAIGRLAGGVAHDFNNILTIIMGHAEKTISMLGRESALAQTAANIHRAAVRGSLLTRQLLSFSRKDVLKPETLDLNDVVAGVEAMLKSLVGETVHLSVVPCEESCLIRADRGQTEQILMNLGVNARDALPDGGNIWIEVSRVNVEENTGSYQGTSFTGPGVLLSVRDDGCGMDDTTFSRLFEPFFTTKEQGKGTGLGLSSAYGIVRECGGYIDVTSAVGKGTTFRIFFPRLEGVLPALLGEAAISGIYTPGSETILVVEDENEVRELAAEALSMSGYEVLQAASARDALKLLASSTKAIHLLLTDVIMPGMSGGELVQRISADHPSIKVLYMSGYSNDSVVQDRVAIAQAAFIQKPFSLESLSSKVREVLDTRSPLLSGQARA